MSSGENLLAKKILGKNITDMKKCAEKNILAKKMPAKKFFCIKICENNILSAKNSCKIITIATKFLQKQYFCKNKILVKKMFCKKTIFLVKKIVAGAVSRC